MPILSSEMSLLLTTIAAKLFFLFVGSSVDVMRKLNYSVYISLCTGRYSGLIALELGYMPYIDFCLCPM